MLAQSLFAITVAPTAQSGDAPAPTADGAFGRLVDVATREAEAGPDAGPGAPVGMQSLPQGPVAALDPARPQVLPVPLDGAAKRKDGDAPRREVLPGELDGDATVVKDAGPQVLPGELDVAPPAPSAKGVEVPTEPRPEVLPADVGPDAPPQPQILPFGVGPGADVKTGTIKPDVPPPVAGTTPPAVSRPEAHGPGHDTLPAPAEAVSEATPEPAPTGSAPPAPAAPTVPEAQVAARPASAIPPMPEPSRLDAGSPPPGEPASAPIDASVPPSAEAPVFSLSRVAHQTLAELTAQIVKRLEGKVTRFDMALTPEDLGRVDVRLEMADDGSLTARLAFDTPAAAAEMRAQVDQLRRQLEQAGFQLARDALEFTNRDGSDHRRQDATDRRQTRAFAAAHGLNETAEASPLMNMSLSLGSARERVDVKV